MGWIGTYGQTNAQVLAELQQQCRGRVDVVDHAWEGSGKLWTLHRLSNGTTFIALTLVQRRDGVTYTKDIDESMEPFHFGCPLRLLDAADPPMNEDAERWRWRCRTYRQTAAKQRARIRALKRGDVVPHTSGERWTYSGPWGKSRTFFLATDTNGRLCKLRFRNVLLPA